MRARYDFKGFAVWIRRGLFGRIALAFLAFFSVTTLVAQAQPASWPQRPVRVIVSLGPGSGADISARLIADRLNKRWGQPVVVENRPGADGVIAINAVLNARDDHTLLFGPSSGFIGHPYQLDKLPYNPKELIPVARVVTTLVAAAVPPALKVNTLKELFDEARKQPGKFNWATATGVTDIILAGFLKSAGLSMQKVPYRDTVQALNDLTEGRIHFYIAALAIVRSQAQAGRVKLIAVTNRQRAPVVPNLPTVDEAGFPALAFDGLAGFFSAPAVPAGLRDRIASDVREVIAADPEITKRLELIGLLVVPGGPAEFAASIKDQADKLAQTAAVLGIKPKQ